MPAEASVTPRMSCQILVVEDDAPFREALRARLHRAGYGVTVASGAQDGLQKAIGAGFDLIVLDLRIPGLGGDELLRAIRPLGLKSKVVVMSAFLDAKLQDRMRDLGAVACVEKPFSFDALVSVIERVTASSPEMRDLAHAKDPDFRNAFWDGLMRFVFAEPGRMHQKKAVALGLVIGMMVLVLWTLFGQRI